MASGPDPKAKRMIRYEKDAGTRIATITFDRPEYLNAPTIAARQRYADLLHRAGVDDDDFRLDHAIQRGLGDAVKANDDHFPPDWRLSKKARRRDRKAKR